MQQTLGLTSIVTTKELAIQNGCIQANDLARKVLQTYKEKVNAIQPADPVTATASSSSSSSSSMVPSSATSIIDSRAVYPVVAFYLSCRHLKIVGQDRKRLMAQHNIKEKEFLQTIESFYKMIPELRPPEKKPSTKGRKRKAKEEGEGDGETNPKGEQRDEEEKEEDNANDEFDEDDDNADSTAAEAGDLDELLSRSMGGNAASSKPLGYAKWKAKVTQEAEEENRQTLLPLAKVNSRPSSTCTIRILILIDSHSFFVLNSLLSPSRNQRVSRLLHSARPQPHHLFTRCHQRLTCAKRN